VIHPVEFLQDDGYRLRGRLYAPRESHGPALVFCHGFGAAVDDIADRFATGLRDRGCTVLLFDYSGFGRSDGPRGRLDPEREVRDVRAAVSYLCANRPRPAAAGVGLVGISFGGAIATTAAARDPRVRTLVSLSAVASGSAWMRDLRPYWQWLKLQDEIEADRSARTAAPSKLVDADWIVPRDPVSAAALAAYKQAHPEHSSRFDLVSAELIQGFEPVREAGRLRDRTALFIHCRRDLLVPVEHASMLADAAAGELLLLSDVGHYTVYEGEAIRTVLDRAAEVFHRPVASAGHTVD